MNIYHTLSREYIHGKSFAMGSVVLALDNKIVLVCKDFDHSRTEKVEILVWLPQRKEWVRTYEKNELTERMWAYYRKTMRPKKARINYEALMKHSRKKKKSSGGIRIGGSSAITDYECTKNPLHDFQRTMYI